MARGGKREKAGRKPGRTVKTLAVLAATDAVGQVNEAAKIIDDARLGRIELAKDVLNRMMKVAEGATSLHRPTTEGEVAAGKPAAGNWPLFGEWFDRTVFCAKELAKYQSPQLRAIMVGSSDIPVPAPKPVTPRGDNVVDIADPQAVARVYRNRILSKQRA